MADRKHRIFIIDDHPLVREWLANLILQQPDLVICGEADNMADALKRIPVTKPDLAIIDLSLGEASGLELIRALKNLHPNILMIVLTMHDERSYAPRALRAGARGYVMKRETANRMVESIRLVLDGKLGVSGDVSQLLSEMVVTGQAAPQESPLEQLSDRELQIFRLLGEGRDTRTIANSLHISIKTVQTYCARIKEKLGLSNATELLREAIRWTENQAA
jgi:DNA-binding NarL/FixJ family response regulator